jgi:hypothetical protein
VSDYEWIPAPETRRLGQGRLRLSPEEVKWIQLKWEKIRKSQQIADEASNRWNRLNGEINRWMDDTGIIDIVQRTSTKSKSLPLRDALETGKWHAAESQRHIDDLNLFLRLKELEVL